jgi:hypothetical protein
VISLRIAVLAIAAISLVIVAGGAVYEHLAVVPQWSAAPPASLTMFQGEYGLAAGRFWPFAHAVTVVLLTTALFLNWRTPARSFISITLCGYVVLLVVTSVYFLPELGAITRTTYQPVTDAALTARAARWELLSLVRLALLLVLAFVLMLGLTVARHEALAQPAP